MHLYSRKLLVLITVTANFLQASQKSHSSLHGNPWRASVYLFVRLAPVSVSSLSATRHRCHSSIHWKLFLQFSSQSPFPSLFPHTPILNLNPRGQIVGISPANRRSSSRDFIHRHSEPGPGSIIGPHTSPWPLASLQLPNSETSQLLAVLSYLSPRLSRPRRNLIQLYTFSHLFIHFIIASRSCLGSFYSFFELRWCSNTPDLYADLQYPHTPLIPSRIRLFFSYIECLALQPSISKQITHHNKPPKVNDNAELILPSQTQGRLKVQEKGRRRGLLRRTASQGTSMDWRLDSHNRWTRRGGRADHPLYRGAQVARYDINLDPWGSVPGLSCTYPLRPVHAIALGGLCIFCTPRLLSDQWLTSCTFDYSSRYPIFTSPLPTNLRPQRRSHLCATLFWQTKWRTSHPRRGTPAGAAHDRTHGAPSRKDKSSRMIHADDWWYRLFQVLSSGAGVDCQEVSSAGIHTNYSRSANKTPTWPETRSRHLSPWVSTTGLEPKSSSNFSIYSRQLRHMEKWTGSEGESSPAWQLGGRSSTTTVARALKEVTSRGSRQLMRQAICSSLTSAV